MKESPRIVAFAGSTRTKSYNKRLVRIAARGATQAGAQVEVVDLRDLNLPIFDEDEEAKNGPPAGATRFKSLLKSCDGILISSPEYNSSLSAALKNAIDWATRPAAGEAPLEAFAGKVAVIMSASPGGLGGLRGLVHLRAILGNIRVIVLPDQHAVGSAHEVIGDDGEISDAELRSKIEGLGATLCNVCKKLG
ncbi:MAG TPA: NAD(P)H-dependent oxidoreductase [Phycisphaerae bacterium]|nr:NAD(P)H-dependent oxidoreductase [Phycisphaerales bacterium]HNO77890.1 NAD(P)H-dependent oxidoreductase [Phycisphaerae bacterium]